jgi:putative membrane protein
MKRLAIAVTAIAMVATPLADIGSSLRVTLAHLVVGGLFVITLLSARSVWGQRAFVASAVIVGIGFGVEIVGSRTGFPFGSYDYTSLLAPQIANVPVVVAFAWCAMALPAREVAGAICGERAPRVARVIVGAVALTAWDVFLDPHMVMEGYWVWFVLRYSSQQLSRLAGRERLAHGRAGGRPSTTRHAAHTRRAICRGGCHGDNRIRVLLR